MTKRTQGGRRKGEKGGAEPWQNWITPIKTIPIHFEVKVRAVEMRPSEMAQRSAEDTEKAKAKMKADEERRRKLLTDKGE